MTLADSCLPVEQKPLSSSASVIAALVPSPQASYDRKADDATLAPHPPVVSWSSPPRHFLEVHETKPSLHPQSSDHGGHQDGLAHVLPEFDRPLSGSFVEKIQAAETQVHALQKVFAAL